MTSTGMRKTQSSTHQKELYTTTKLNLLYTKIFSSRMLVITSCAKVLTVIHSYDFCDLSVLTAILKMQITSWITSKYIKRWFKGHSKVNLHWVETFIAAFSLRITTFSKWLKPQTLAGWGLFPLATIFSVLRVCLKIRLILLLGKLLVT